MRLVFLATVVKIGRLVGRVDRADSDAFDAFGKQIV